MKVLIAEDEYGMRYAVMQALKLNGIEANEAENGQQAVEMARSGAYDCMVFDIMMPVMDGIEALRQIRAAGDATPVIMLTAKSEVDDRIEGLDSGADDYLTKPFAMKELLARIRSQVRRREQTYSEKLISYGNITLDMEKLELKAANGISLAKKEARLLEFLIRNEGKALSTEDIHARIWDDDPRMETEAVWVYISYLREKLGSVDADVVIEGEKNGDFYISLKADNNGGSI